jgi:hypothetical protein
MSDKRTYVERRPDTGEYVVVRPNYERASGVFPTQKEAIERAKELNPNMNPVVERVRHTEEGTPGRWRKS